MPTKVDQILAVRAFRFLEPIQCDTYWGRLMFGEFPMQLKPLARMGTYDHESGPVIKNRPEQISMKNSCGLWSVKPQHIFKVIRNYSSTETPWGKVGIDLVDVIGVVSLLGKVIEHEIGYRSEGMLLLNLYVNKRFTKDYERISKALEDKYHCDVHLGFPSGRKLRQLWKSESRLEFSE